VPPNAPDEKIAEDAAAAAIRLAVRLHDAAPVDATPPDPRLTAEARAEAERAAGAGIALGDVADAARQVGVGAETLRMALLAVQAGGPALGAGGRVIALSRRLSSNMLEAGELGQRLGALGLEQVARAEEGAATLMVFRFRLSGFWRKALAGVEGAAQRLGWPLLLVTLRREEGGGAVVVFRVESPAETPEPFRRMVRGAVGSSLAVSTVAAVPALILSPAVAALAFAGSASLLLYRRLGHRLSARKAEEVLERRLKTFLANLEPPAAR
jgi:hypothetical protein